MSPGNVLVSPLFYELRDDDHGTPAPEGWGVVHDEEKEPGESLVAAHAARERCTCGKPVPNKRRGTGSCAERCGIA